MIKKKKTAIKNQSHVPKTINKSKNIPKQEKAKETNPNENWVFEFFFFFVIYILVFSTLPWYENNQSKKKQSRTITGMAWRTHLPADQGSEIFFIFLVSRWRWLTGRSAMSSIFFGGHSCFTCTGCCWFTLMTQCSPLPCALDEHEEDLCCIWEREREWLRFL